MMMRRRMLLAALGNRSSEGESGEKKANVGVLEIQHTSLGICMATVTFAYAVDVDVHIYIETDSTYVTLTVAAGNTTGSTRTSGTFVSASMSIDGTSAAYDYSIEIESTTFHFPLYLRTQLDEESLATDYPYRWREADDVSSALGEWLDEVRDTGGVTWDKYILYDAATYPIFIDGNAVTEITYDAGSYMMYVENIYDAYEGYIVPSGYCTLDTTADELIIDIEKI